MYVYILQTGEPLLEFSLNVGSAINSKGEVLVRLKETLIEAEVLTYAVRRPWLCVNFEHRFSSLVSLLVTAALRAPDLLGVDGRTAEAREDAIVRQRCVAEFLEEDLLIIVGCWIRLCFHAQLPCPAFVQEGEWKGVIEHLRSHEQHIPKRHHRSCLPSVAVMVVVHAGSNDGERGNERFTKPAYYDDACRSNRRVALDLGPHEKEKKKRGERQSDESHLVTLFRLLEAIRTHHKVVTPALRLACHVEEVIHFHEALEIEVHDTDEVPGLDNLALEEEVALRVAQIRESLDAVGDACRLFFVLRNDVETAIERLIGEHLASFDGEMQRHDDENFHIKLSLRSTERDDRPKHIFGHRIREEALQYERRLFRLRRKEAECLNCTYCIQLQEEQYAYSSYACVQRES